PNRYLRCIRYEIRLVCHSEKVQPVLHVRCGFFRFPRLAVIAKWLAWRCLPIETVQVTIALHCSGTATLCRTLQADVVGDDPQLPWGRVSPNQLFDQRVGFGVLD